ncbi:MAG: hypothetical protein D6784_04345 [Chloroflexi bacterium]|nr:MAG: hypothetical protein D6784_04345 [Chloroflexota bacterium]
MKLSRESLSLLRAIAAGGVLKSHRDLDGHKVYRLHPLDGPAWTVSRAAVQALERQGVIMSNQKFPTASYLLTDRGRELLARQVATDSLPLSARNFPA